MRIRRDLPLLLSLLFFVSCPSTHSAAGETPTPERDLALIRAKVYLSPAEPPIENGSILVHYGHILAVGPRATIKIPRQATVIDCKGLVVLEFTLVSRGGMNSQQILASLTTNPARRFGYSNRNGRIAKGMDADLVVLRVDPAQDVTAFSKVRYTIRSGKVIHSEK